MPAGVDGSVAVVVATGCDSESAVVVAGVVVAAGAGVAVAVFAGAGFVSAGFDDTAGVAGAAFCAGCFAGEGVCACAACVVSDSSEFSSTFFTGFSFF